jgi:hypothetical protein
MNSLKTLHALNLVVNHDTCPQMKKLVLENAQMKKEMEQMLTHSKLMEDGYNRYRNLIRAHILGGNDFYIATNEDDEEDEFTQYEN